MKVVKNGVFITSVTLSIVFIVLSVFCIIKYERQVEEIEQLNYQIKHQNQLIEFLQELKCTN